MVISVADWLESKRSTFIGIFSFFYIFLFVILCFLFCFFFGNNCANSFVCFFYFILFQWIGHTESSLSFYYIQNIIYLTKSSTSWRPTSDEVLLEKIHIDSTIAHNTTTKCNSRNRSISKPPPTTSKQSTSIEERFRIEWFYSINRSVWFGSTNSNYSLLKCLYAGSEKICAKYFYTTNNCKSRQ